MRKERAVLRALRDLAAMALPQADVRGFEGDTTKPKRLGEHGTVIGHPGEPGEPEVDLGPLTYHYEHEFRLEVAGPDGKAGEALDAMLSALGEAIRADRTLGGLCTWLEAAAPDRNDRTVGGAVTSNWAVVSVTAHYSTTDPLA
jgi:hypothetical protein